MQFDDEGLVGRARQVTCNATRWGTSSCRYNEFREIVAITNALNGASKVDHDINGLFAPRTDAADSTAAALTTIRFDDGCNAIQIDDKRRCDSAPA